MEKGVCGLRDFTDYEGMAMLELPESGRSRLRDRFNGIADSFSTLDEYDVSSVEPLVTVLDLVNVLRDDVSVKSFSREDLLSNAPEQHDGYFQVPATID